MATADDQPFTRSNAAALDRWHDSVAAVTGEQLDSVGYCQYPWSDAADRSRAARAAVEVGQKRERPMAGRLVAT
jgi:hypothetical protein